MALGRTTLRPLGTLLLALVALLLSACTSPGDEVTTTAPGGSAAGDETIDDGVSSSEEPMPTMAPPAQEIGPATPMQTVADVSELLASWQERGPRTYNYTGHLFSVTMEEMVDGSNVECGSSGGRLAVWVVDDQAAEGQMPESACVIDLASPTRLPLTAEELFARTIDFMGEDSFGARVEVNEFGFPSSIFTESRIGVIEFSLSTFAEGEGPAGVIADERARLKRAQARWDATRPDAYELEVERTCRCAPPYRAPFDVRVDGDDVSATVNGASLPDDLSAAAFTVDGLFAAIDGWLEADRLQVIYDAERGIPVRINVDPSSGIADDEVTLEVTRYLGDGPRDLETLLREIEAAVDDAPADAITLGDATFCGFDDASLNDEPIGGDPIARACLSSRSERGEAAVLVQRYPTTEGDPIIQVLKANADGSLTLHSDNSQDTFGSGGWQRSTCSAIEPRPEIGANFFSLRC